MKLKCGSGPQFPMGRSKLRKVLIYQHLHFRKAVLEGAFKSPVGETKSQKSDRQEGPSQEWSWRFLKNDNVKVSFRGMWAVCIGKIS